ncbi:phage gene 29 protein family protein [Corynebacterium kalidii]
MIPLQKDMDLSDPVESILWALVKLNGKQGAPLLTPVPLMREQAQNLYDRGLRFHPELQKSWYHPPANEGSFDAQLSGEWKDSQPSSESEPVSKALSMMSDEMKAELRRQLNEGV